MDKRRHKTQTKGTGMVELVVAVGLIGVILVPAVSTFLLSQRSIASTESRSEAHFLAQRYIEAAKNVRDRKWDDIANASSTIPYYLSISNGFWQLVPGEETIRGFTARVYIRPVLRDIAGAIVESGGTADSLMRKIDVQITWSDKGAPRIIRVSNYVTQINALTDFVYSFNQDYREDFDAGAKTNINTSDRPGEFTLARPITFSYTFDSDAANSDPANWTDTGANYSLVANNAFFKVLDVGADRAFGTSSTSANIHSHYVGAGATAWTNYEFSGRMYLSNLTGGVGVTFLSKYPTSDKYYTLIYDDANAEDDFILLARNTTLATRGVQDYRSGVVPAANTWYRFKIQVKDVSSQTLIVGKIWKDGEQEPLSNQIDHFDESATRSATGTIGIWGKGNGSKYIDDLEIRDLTKYTVSGDLVSSSYDMRQTTNPDQILWDFDAPSNTSVQFRIRTAATEAGLSSASWYGPTNTTDYYTEFWGQKINAVHNASRWIQYRAYLTTSNASTTPAVDRIRILYVKQ